MGLLSPGAAEILRAGQKDNDYITKLGQDIDEVLQNLLGQSYWLKWRRLTRFVSPIIYFSLTNMMGNQTLGEEYAGIVQVDQTKTFVPSKKRIFVTVLLSTFGSMIFVEKLIKKAENFEFLKNKSGISRHVGSGMKTINYWLPFLTQLHLVIFYLQGKFYHFAKRITGINYVLVRKWYADQDEDGKKNLKYLVWMSFVNLIVTAIKDSNKALSLYQSKSKEKETIKETKKGDGDGTVTGSCSLCLEPRKNPSLTSCGHVFCWHCILDWLGTKQECPVCRDQVTPSRVVPLQNFL